MQRKCSTREDKENVLEPQHDAEMQVLEAVIFEKRVMLKDCRDANTVSWMQWEKCRHDEERN
jgi:hypothetical protein